MSTSNKSKKSSAKKSNGAVDRPFDPAILQAAREIAKNYQMVVWYEEDHWFGKGVELPTTMNDGVTAEECTKNVQESFVTTVAYMLENGDKPPPAATIGARTEQVNFRLSAEERLRIDAAAKQRGFEGLSDFVRWAALAAAGKL